MLGKEYRVVRNGKYFCPQQKFAFFWQNMKKIVRSYSYYDEIIEEGWTVESTKKVIYVTQPIKFRSIDKAIDYISLRYTRI